MNAERVSTSATRSDWQCVFGVTEAADDRRGLLRAGREHAAGRRAAHINDARALVLCSAHGCRGHLHWGFHCRFRRHCNWTSQKGLSTPFLTIYQTVFFFYSNVHYIFLRSFNDQPIGISTYASATWLEKWYHRQVPRPRFTSFLKPIERLCWMTLDSILVSHHENDNLIACFTIGKDPSER